MKKLLQNIIVLIFGMMLALVVGELFSRAIYKKLYPDGPWYNRLLWEQIYGDWKDSLKLNSFGLRDQDHAGVKTENSCRVLILGDSFAFGSGVRDHEVFTELLENRFISEYSGSGKNIEFMNGGIVGSMTYHWLDLLLRIKDSFNPDVVLIVFFLRDGSNINSQEAIFEPIRNFLKPKEKKSWLYTHSYLVRIFEDSMNRLALSTKYTRMLNDSYFGNMEQIREWEKAKENILKIKAISNQIHAKVGLVVFPVLIDFNRNYPFKRICNLIMKFGIENNIPSHNLLPAFMGEYAPNLWVSGFDQHPNVRAHKIAADSIFPFLKELLKERLTSKK